MGQLVESVYQVIRHPVVNSVSEWVAIKSATQIFFANISRSAKTFSYHIHLPSHSPSQWIRHSVTKDSQMITEDIHLVKSVSHRRELFKKVSPSRMLVSESFIQSTSLVIRLVNQPLNLSVRQSVIKVRWSIIQSLIHLAPDWVNHSFRCHCQFYSHTVSNSFKKSVTKNSQSTDSFIQRVSHFESQSASHGFSKSANQSVVEVSKLIGSQSTMLFR